MRPAISPEKRALRRLQTIAWIHGVRTAAVHHDGLDPEITPGGLEKALVKKHGKHFRFLDGSKIINRYRRDERAPSPSRLKLFERIYPGTRNIFENGPDQSYLWSAVACRDDQTATAEALSRIKSNIQHGIYVETKVANAPIPGVQEVLVPASLARSLQLYDADHLEIRNKRFADCFAQNRDLIYSLSGRYVRLLYGGAVDRFKFGCHFFAR